MAKSLKHIEEFQDLLDQLMFNLLKKDPGILSSMDLTEAQFAAGRILSNKESATMSELAHGIGESLPTSTGVINKLVLRKYAVREKDKNDRRLVKVRLTTLGRGVIDKIHQRKREHFRHIIEVLQEEDQEKLVRLLHKIVDGVKVSSKV